MQRPNFYLPHTPQPTLARGAEEPGEYLLHDCDDAGTRDGTRTMRINGWVSKCTSQNAKYRDSMGSRALQVAYAGSDALEKKKTKQI